MNFLIFEKRGYNKDFADDCVEWFVKEMLEIETYLKQ